MAKLDVKGLGKLINDMKVTGQLASPTASRMLEAGGEQYAETWKDEAETRGYRSRGKRAKKHMIDSIAPTKVKKDKNGMKYVDVYPQGTDPGRKPHKDGTPVRNAEKAYLLHYGHSSQPGTRWIDAANQRATPLADEKMIGIWDDYLKERGL